MKKLNRKGFTLVELLAVIVILAIVVGIAIPGVTSVINGAKHSAMETALKTAHGFLKKQFDVSIITPENVDPSISPLLTAATTTVTDETTLKTLGFNDNSVASLTITTNYNVNAQTNTFCLTINELTSGSDYLSTTYWNNDGKPKNTNDTTERRYGTCS